MANQDPARSAQNPLYDPICEIRQNEQKPVAKDVFWVGTYCSVLEVVGFASLLRTWGSSRSLNRFVGSPFIQQIPHNYGEPTK